METVRCGDVTERRLRRRSKEAPDEYDSHRFYSARSSAFYPLVQFAEFRRRSFRYVSYILHHVVHLPSSPLIQTGAGAGDADGHTHGCCSGIVEIVVRGIVGIVEQPVSSASATTSLILSA